ncbi:3-oxoacyl-[acyl-carrier protein] reductase [hydrothermal vent metagenome]|uniref:3-oxoacyl-[acyl-carrier protein] reductase n=1 Tax=hydrothermal vent metagenome TaxID=652676 RepID=A0A3B0S8B8_9ZZZZ
MLRKNFDLSGKIALVNGASRGIGEAIALGLAEAGAHVICTSRKLDGCQAVADKITKAGNSAEAFICHAGEQASIAELLEMIASKHGKLHILVNNGATSPFYGPIAETPEWAFDKTVDVNLKGPFFLSAGAVPLMQKAGSGSIINIASINAIQPGLLQGVYSITKAALISMSKAFAKEYAGANIRCNAVLPGFTDTKMTAVFKQDEKLLDKMLRENIPMNRMAQPSEMVGAVLYLASDASSYTTGSEIVVDGGYLL